MTIGDIAMVKEEEKNMVNGILDLSAKFLREELTKEECQSRHQLDTDINQSNYHGIGQKNDLKDQDKKLIE